jgi:hypothetical protein
MLFFGASLLPHIHAQTCEGDFTCSQYCGGFCYAGPFQGQLPPTCMCPGGHCPITCQYNGRNDGICECLSGVFCGIYQNGACRDPVGRRPVTSAPVAPTPSPRPRPSASPSTPAPSPRPAPSATSSTSSAPAPSSGISVEVAGSNQGQTVDGVGIFFAVFSLLFVVYETTSLFFELKSKRRILDQHDPLWRFMQVLSNQSIAPVPDEPLDVWSLKLKYGFRFLLFGQSFIVTAVVLRLFDFNFAGCSRPECNKVANANVFAALQGIFGCVVTAFLIYPCQAVTYKVDEHFALKLLKCAYVITNSLVSLARATYETWLSESSVISSQRPFVEAIYIATGFATAVVATSMTMSLEWASRWSGFHALFCTPLKHVLLARLTLFTCGRPCYGYLHDTEVNWFKKLVAVQDDLRAKGETVPFDLEQSAILRACNWREYMRNDDVAGLFARLKAQTNKDGNMIGGAKSQATVGFAV